MSVFKYKRGYTIDLYGYKVPAYLIIKENIVVAKIYHWSMFYPQKLYNVFLREFKKIGEINYIVFLTGSMKSFESETLRDAKEWLESNWDNERFTFNRKEELLTAIYVPEIILK